MRNFAKALKCVVLDAVVASVANTIANRMRMQLFASRFIGLRFIAL